MNYLNREVIFLKDGAGMAHVSLKNSSAFGFELEETVPYRELNIQSLDVLLAAAKFESLHWSIQSKDISLGERINVKKLHILKCLNRCSILEARLRLEQLGMAPVQIRQALNFSIDFPSTQRLFPIVALGTVFRMPYGDEASPYLGELHNGKRTLAPFFYQSGIDKEVRLLASDLIENIEIQKIRISRPDAA